MRKRIFAWLFALLLLGSVTLAESNMPSAGDAPATDAVPMYAAYNGKRIGVATGTTFDAIVR